GCVLRESDDQHSGASEPTAHPPPRTSPVAPEAGAPLPEVRRPGPHHRCHRPRRPDAGRAGARVRSATEKGGGRMSEGVLIALIGAGATVAGAVLTAVLADRTASPPGKGDEKAAENAADPAVDRLLDELVRRRERIT